MIWLFAVIIGCLTSQALQANPAEDAWEAYLTGDFDRVATIVSSFQTDTSLTNHDRARLYMALGSSDAMRARNATAIAAFERALSLDPAQSYSQADLPPPVWRLYSPVQLRLKTQAPDLTTSGSIGDMETSVKHDTIITYIPVMRDRLTVVKSLAFPGWGHVCEHRKRGYLFIGFEAAMIAGWAACHIQMNEAEKDYLSASDLKEINSSYDKYNTWYNMTWAFGLSALAGYVVSQADFFSYPPPITIGYQQQSNAGLLSLSFRL